MKILFLGNKDRGIQALDALLQDGHEVIGVVCPPDDEIENWYPSISEFAQESDLNVIQPDSINDSDIVKILKDWNPEIGVMAGFSQILGEKVLSIPKEGFINLHAGKLPEYRGASVMNWAIINGDDRITLTIHYVTKQIDAGPIIAEKDIPVSDQATINEIRNSANHEFRALLQTAIHDIVKDNIKLRTIDPEAGVYWYSRRPIDGKIFWRDMTAEDVHNLVRALTMPYPGAYTFTGDGEKLFIWQSKMLDSTKKHVPGKVCHLRENGAVVMAKDRCLLVKKVQLNGHSKANARNVLESGTYLGPDNITESK